MNWLEEVRSTSRAVVNQSTSVWISDDNIDALIRNDEVFPKEINKSLSKIEWDSAGWHYCADAADKGPMTAQYILVMDALNFCFWPCEGFEYDNLAVSLKKVVEQNPEEISARYLSTITEEDVSRWFSGWTLPQLPERVKRLREVGIGLLADYDGLAMNMIQRANHSANSLVDLVLKSFVGFRDTVVYKGQLIHFYKRAQIFVGDLWGAYGKPTDPSHPCYFKDIYDITMFADYRVPQILYHIGIMRYSEELAEKIRNRQQIPFGSELETEIRAATVISVEKIREKLLSEKNVKVLSLEVDWILWNWGEKVKDNIEPHHRTLTIYY